MSDRRSFLRGLVTLPLIGGGVTLIGTPAEAVPLVQAAAMPAFATPLARARYAWEAFASAMREVTAADDGWCILGAAERLTPLPDVHPTSFVRVAAIRYETGPHPGYRDPIVFERHKEIDLDGSAALWRGEA